MRCKFDENRSSNPGDYETNKCTSLHEKQKSAYLTEYIN